MSEKNILENEVQEKRTAFEWVKIQAPQIDGYFKAQFEMIKKQLHRELDFKFDDEEKLAFLDAERKELREFMKGEYVYVLCSWGDSVIDMNVENLDLTSMFAHLFSDVNSILKFSPVLADANGMDIPPDYFQQLTKMVEGLNNPLYEIDTKKLYDLIEIGLENTYKQKNRDWEVLKEVNKVLRKDTIEDSTQAMLSEVYYKRKQFEYVCNLYNNIEHKMINGNTEKVNESNIKWKGDKIELIKVLVALNELGYFETKDGDKATTKKVMEEFGDFLGLDFTQYSSSLNRHLKGSEQNIFGIFNKMKKVIQEKREN